MLISILFVIVCDEQDEDTASDTILEHATEELDEDGSIASG